jgi:conjugative transposon TraM protein
MEQQRSQKFIRQRRFFMALPLLALPFITLLFWALGGGKITQADAQAQNKKGIKLELPGAHLKDNDGLNKMGYYDQANADTLKRRELMKNDPYYRDGSLSLSSMDVAALSTDSGYPPRQSMTASPYRSGYQDANEAKVYGRLKQLDDALNAPVNKQQEYKPTNPSSGNMANGKDMDRLEQMMQAMQQGDGANPEMQQLDGMMERILDMQHPERVQEKLRQASAMRKGQVFAVSSARRPDPISILGTNENNHQAIQPMTASQSGFYSFDNLLPSPDTQNAIEAVVHETQTIMSGATVKLRLLNDIFINGILIPRDNFIYGTANLSGERLRIQIAGVRYLNRLFPVAMNVYDTDGLEGINVPGAITRDVAKQSADRSMQNLGFTSVDPSWQVQAAGAGVEAAKSLFSRKVKLVKVTLKAGYQVLLYDEKQKQSDK